MNRNECRRAETAVERARIASRVLAYLAAHGPTPYADLVAELNCKAGQLQKVGTDLMNDGKLYSYRRAPGRDSTRLWSVTTPPTKPERRAPPKKSTAVWSTPEDDAWIEYWRTPRAERRKREGRAW